MTSRYTLIAAAIALAFGHAAAQTISTPAAASSTQSNERFTPQEQERAITTSRMLMERKLPSLACDLIKRTHGSHTQSPDALYLLANCSRELGKTEESLDYYERLVKVLPNAARPKAELAAMYTAEGRADEARVLYQQVAELQKGTEPAILFQRLSGTEPVQDPAKAVSGPKRWQIDLYGGLLHDTNLNAGPGSSNIAAVIGGVPVTLILDEASRPKEATGYNLSFGGRYLVPLSNEWAILYQGNLSVSDYFETTSYNSESLAAGAAFIYKQPGYSISIQPNLRYVRQGSSLQERTAGLNGRFTKTLSQTLEVFGTLGYFKRDVPVADYRDANGYLAGAGVNHVLQDGVQVGGEYVFQREDADLDSESRDLHGPSVYVAAALMPRLDTMASYGYTMTRHDKRQALFADAREDRQHRLGLSASYKIPGITNSDLRLVTEYNYFRNQSTVDLNDYKRHVITVGLQARF